MLQSATQQYVSPESRPTRKPSSPQGAGKKGIMRQNELGLYSNKPSLNVPRIYVGDQKGALPTLVSWYLQVMYVPSLFKKNAFVDLIFRHNRKYLLQISQEVVKSEGSIAELGFRIFPQTQTFLVAFVHLKFIYNKNAFVDLISDIVIEKIQI